MQTKCVNRIHEYWQSIRRDGGMPLRVDFSPADVTECLPHIFIVERKSQNDSGEPDYVIRLIGTQLVEQFGGDPTGRSLFEIMPPEAVEFFKVLYARVLERPAGALLYFTQSFGRIEESKLEFLYLPMMLNAEKGDADLILCTAVALDDDAQLSDMGGRWDTPKLDGGGWLDTGCGKPEDPFLQNVCAAMGAEYMEF